MLERTVMSLFVEDDEWHVLGGEAVRVQKLAVQRLSVWVVGRGEESFNAVRQIVIPDLGVEHNLVVRISDRVELDTATEVIRVPRQPITP